MRKQLASETSADIWLAYDRDIDRDCLVRVYRAGDNADDKTIEREQQAFLMQAQALAAIDHPNVARIYDTRLTPDGAPYVVLPPYPRRLTERLAGSAPVRGKEAEVLTVGALRGLAAAHAAGVCHGALGPESIFLKPKEPRVKLFGFSERRQNTTAGEWPAAVVADIFQVGLLAYRLYAGTSPDQAMRRPREAAPSVPDAVDEWIVACLSRDPAARPASAIAAQETFQTAIASEPRREKAHA